MSFLIRVPIFTNNTNFPIVDSNDIYDLRSNSVEDSYGHWVFGSDTGYINSLNGRELTAQGAAPTINQNNIELKTSTFGNSLISDFSDRDGVTTCIVFQAKSFTSFSDSFQLIECGPGSQSVGYNSIIRGDSKSHSAFTRGFTGNPNNSTINLIEGEWYFASYSQLGLESISFIAGSQSNASNRLTSSSQKNVNSSYSASIGASFNNSSDVLNNFKVAEFILIDGFKTESEIINIYTRSKSRMLARGIAI